MTGVIVSQLPSGLLDIELNRPEKLNALTPAMIVELRQAFVAAAGADEVRAVLLRGAGRSFCAGRDLASATPGEDAEAIIAQDINPLIQSLYDIGVPTVAAVRGAAMGIGLGLALACDLVYAGRSATFSVPFARLGAALDSGGHFFLQRAIGERRALEMIYTAEPVIGAAAVEAGLATRCVADEMVDDVARTIAERLARGSTTAFRHQKRLMRSTPELSLAQVLAAEAYVQGNLARTPEYAEGLAAFAARRVPDFEAARQSSR